MALIKTRRPLRGKSLGMTGFPGFPAFDELENRMATFFDNPLTPFEESLVTQPMSWIPAMDIVDSEKELVLIAELPGLEKKDVEIAIEDGVLTLRGEKLEEKKENGAEKKYYLFERAFGSFNRTFTLPRFVDANKISAEFDKGVLKIHLPKTGELETKGRKIEIAVK
jgi:HSP20 family protein